MLSEEKDELQEKIAELDYDIKMLVRFSIVGFLIFAIMCFMVILYVAKSFGVLG